MSTEGRVGRDGLDGHDGYQGQGWMGGRLVLLLLGHLSSLAQAPQAPCPPQLEQLRAHWQPPGAPAWLPRALRPPPHRAPKAAGQGPSSRLGKCAGRIRHSLQARASPRPVLSLPHRLPGEALWPGPLCFDVQRSARSRGPAHDHYLSQKAKPGPQPS